MGIRPDDAIWTNGSKEIQNVPQLITLIEYGLAVTGNSTVRSEAVMNWETRVPVREKC